MAVGIPWPAMLRQAALIAIPPAAFWRLSVREWVWLTRAPAADRLNASGLSELAARFPDEETK